jgi:hypothetical protein
MRSHLTRLIVALVWLATGIAVPAQANELWIAPTYQQDAGGLGIGSNTVWPVTAVGTVRLAWGVPNDLQMFQSARLVLIPHAPGGGGTLDVQVCAAENAQNVAAACTATPVSHSFVGVADELLEVDITAAIASFVGTPGLNHLAVLASTSTTTDHIVGLRFVYAAAVPAGAATLGANTFTDTQTAPAFVGDGSGVTNVDATLLDGLDATAFATLGDNIFTGSQAIFGGVGINQATLALLQSNLSMNQGDILINQGNIDLDDGNPAKGQITKDGVRFLHNAGDRNTFLGIEAGNPTMTGSANTATGNEALPSNTAGDANTAHGAYALFSNTTGSSNTAIGYNALRVSTITSYNTATGSGALRYTTGSSNTANGYQALYKTTGFYNTAVGSQALLNLLGGDNNVAVGYTALHDMQDGADNVAVGRAALFNTEGDNNVAVGKWAGYSAQGSNNIYLGTGVVGATESNTMRLGNAVSKTFIAGIRGKILADTLPVVINPAGQLGTAPPSSRRYKEDIRDMADTSRRLLQLRPVTFRYTQAYEDGATPVQFGLIAEEVAEVFPELVVHDADGRPDAVHYETLNVLLLNELQKQQQRIEALEGQLRELTTRDATR